MQRLEAEGLLREAVNLISTHMRARCFPSQSLPVAVSVRQLCIFVSEFWRGLGLFLLWVPCIRRSLRSSPPRRTTTSTTSTTTGRYIKPRLRSDEPQHAYPIQQNAHNQPVFNPEPDCPHGRSTFRQPRTTKSLFIFSSECANCFRRQWAPAPRRRARNDQCPQERPMSRRWSRHSFADDSPQIRLRIAVVELFDSKTEVVLMFFEVG